MPNAATLLAAGLARLPLRKQRRGNLLSNLRSNMFSRPEAHVTKRQLFEVQIASLLYILPHAESQGSQTEVMSKPGVATQGLAGFGKGNNRGIPVKVSARNSQKQKGTASALGGETRGPPTPPLPINPRGTHKGLSYIRRRYGESFTENKNPLVLPTSGWPTSNGNYAVSTQAGG